ncbi:MAG: hypothetical protein ACRCTP_10655 [Aeromonas popoffii]|uniref:hypothetical protein n=1 Tax=Aeromonas popoffii TaxID=70856 RepID=UPI003F2FEEF0
MIEKSKLLSQPRDFEQLELLESYLESGAKKYIKEVFIPSFSVDKVEFKCVLDNSFAKAERKHDGHYTISIGRSLTNAILNFTYEIEDRVKFKIGWNALEDITDFVFSYISWFILNHELAHISLGHLDYICDKGMNGHAEINYKKVPIKHLHHNEAKPKEYWNALESAADANSISTTLISLKYNIRSEQWRAWGLNKVLEVHGIINSIMFYFLNTLMKGTSDFKHPEPYIRQYLSLPSIDSLAKQLGHDQKFYTDTMIRANFLTVEEILQLKVPFDSILKSVSWMKKLDGLTKEAGIGQYHRKKLVG